MNGYKEFCCVTKSEKRLDNNVYLFPNASSGNTEIGWQGGRVAEWLGCWTSSPWVPGSNPTLSTLWICFSVVPSYKSFGCACI